MPTIPRTYLMKSKAEAAAIQPKSGQVIALYDSDEIYFDVPLNGDPQSDQVERRKVSGTIVISEADLADYKPVGDKTPMTDVIYVVTRDGNTESKLPDNSPLFDARIWFDNDWKIIGTNKDDIYVKSEPSDGTFYLVGAATATESTSTLLKNSAVSVNNGVIQGEISQAQHANTADTATAATYDTATPTAHALTSYLRTVSSNYGAQGDMPGTVLTFNLGDGTAVPIQVRDTQYSVVHTDTNGLVPGPSSSDAGKFLQVNNSGNGTWVEIPDYSGATSLDAGTHGLVPAAAAGNLDSYLRGDGTWGGVFDGTGVGLVPALSQGQTPADAILTGAGWASQPTVDAANKDGLGQVIASTYIKDGSFDSVTNKLILTYGDSTVATPHVDEVTIPSYSVFDTSNNGIVPHPTAADASKVLSSAGTWVPVAVADTVNNVSDPLYVVGAASQSSATATNSNSFVCIQDSKLYQAGAAVEGQDTFTGDGTTKDFALTYSAAAITEVTVGGSTVSSGYNLEDNYLVFDSAPASGVSIVVKYNAPNSAQVVDVTSTQALTNKTYEGYTLGSACSATTGTSLEPTSATLDTFTGDGSETTFTLTNTLVSIIAVDINGTDVPSTDYTISGDDITFNTPPTSGADITITYNTNNPGYGASKLPTSSAVTSYIADNVTSVLATKFDNNDVANAYSDTQIYSLGSYVIYDAGSGSALYKCTTAVTSAEDFDPAKWTAVQLSTLFGIELYGTLAVGNTSVTISDARITTTSRVEYYTDVFGVNATNITVTSGQVVLTFEAQATAVEVMVIIR